MKAGRFKDESQSRIVVRSSERIGGNYISRSRLQNCADPILKKELIQKMNELNKKGVTKSQFEDVVWEFRIPGIDKITVRFDTLSASLYKEEYEICMPMSEFIEHLKYFCLFFLNANSMPVIQKRMRNLVRNIERSKYFSTEIYFMGNEASTNQEILIDFASWLPVDNNEFIYSIENKVIDSEDRDYSKPRELADLQTYLILDEEVSRYEQKKREKLRNYFLPFIIGWKIASILPIRPTELSFLPLDCIEYDQQTGKYVLYYPVSEMKGALKNRYFAYNMADYAIAWTNVTEDIAYLIHEYQNKTKNNKRNDTRLFCTSFYKECSPKKVSKTSDQFNADHMQYLIDDFYSLVLSEEFGYSVLKKEDYKNLTAADYRAIFGKRITRVTFGDLRVLTMIGMWKYGASIKAMMTLTHHRSKQMVEFYSHNLRSFLQSYIYFLLSQFNTPDIVEPEECDEEVEEEQIKEMIERRFNGDRTDPIDVGLYWCYAYPNGEITFEKCQEAILKRPIGDVDVCKYCSHKEPKKEFSELIKISRNDEIRADAKALCKMLPVGTGIISMATVKDAMEKVLLDSQVLFMDLLEEIIEERKKENNGS